MKCRYCGAEIPRFTGMWENVCPSCGRSLTSIRFLALILALQVVILISISGSIAANGRAAPSDVFVVGLTAALVVLLTANIAVLMRRRRQYRIQMSIPVAGDR